MKSHLLPYFTFLLFCMPARMEAAASNCTTTDGRQCVFPFQFFGRTYNECTWDWAINSEGNGSAWCGTQETAYSWNDNTWGECGGGCLIQGMKQTKIKSLHLTSFPLSERCDTEEGYPCHFPFEYNDEKFYTCIWEDSQWRNDSAWCQTSYSGWQWGACRPECPVSGK